MLLQTNLIGRLTDLGLTVAIVSEGTEDENFKVFADNPKVKLLEWKGKKSIWDDDYLYKRMYFLEDINKNTALHEKFHNALFFSKSLHPWKRIRPLYYYFIYKLIKYFPSIRSNFLNKEHEHLQSSEAKVILDEVQPRLLVSTYPVNIIDAKMLYQAKQNGVKTILHLLSWDNITCKGKFPVMADEFIAWGDIMKEELTEYYGLPEDKITVCGVPHFDEHIKVREKGEYHIAVKEMGLSAEKPYLFFAMSSPRFAPREIDIVEWLAKSIETNKFGDTLQLIVRPHPQNVQDFTAKKSWLGRLDNLVTDRVKIDYPDMLESNIRWSMKKGDMTRMSNLISGCSICFNSGSTISIDALMHNKPVILTSFDGDANIPYWNSARRLKDYTHLAKLVKEGGAISVNSFEAMTSAIEAYLNQPDLNLSKRRNALLKECFQDDGLSTGRVANTLFNALQKTP
jgi:hypothetical protein